MSGVMAQRLGLKVFGKPLSVGTALARGKMTSSGFVKFLKFVFQDCQISAHRPLFFLLCNQILMWAYNS